jgi:hypothetical protein
VGYAVAAALPFVSWFGLGRAASAARARHALIVSRLRRVSRKVWLTLHIGIGVGWLGASLAMLALSIVGATTGSHEMRHGAYALMDTFNNALAIPSALMAIVTGVVVSLGTPWGLVKHHWVLAKLIIALSLPVLATFGGPWIDELVVRGGDYAAEPGGAAILLVGAMALFLALLWTATILSVFRPGGRTRWGRREGGQRHPSQTAVAASLVRA